MYSCISATTNLVFGQLYFTGLQVNADRLTSLQLFSSPRKPCVQLIQCVLKLTQTQQSTLQLMLVVAWEKKVKYILYIYLFFAVCLFFS